MHTSRPMGTRLGISPKGIPVRPKNTGIPSLNLCCSQ